MRKGNRRRISLYKEGFTASVDLNLSAQFIANIRETLGMKTYGSERPEQQNQVAFLTTVDWQEISSYLKLSARQTEIAILVFANYSEVTIAQMLSISSHTVHSHLERLYRKLSVRSRCELIVRVFEAYVQLNCERTKGGDFYNLQSATTI